MKILCIPYTHTLSHISRPLAVGIELRKRGHDVIFAGESPKKNFIERECFPVLPLHEPDPDELFDNIRSGKLRFVREEEIELMIEADLALYRDVRPDIVLTDGRFTAPISTHIAGLKHAAIVNVSSTEYRALPYIPFFGWVPEFIAGSGSYWKGVLNTLNLKLEMLTFNNSMNTFSKLSKKYKISKTVTATNCLTGKDITLLADIPEYFPTKNLPEDYHYIGPLTWKQSNVSTPPWWPPKKINNPLVYITMGTTGISNFFTLVYDLFKSSDFSAIITTGGQISGIKSIEGKIFVEDYIDGDLAMEVSDLVICHGGNGTIYQALSHGKPVIGVPTIPDQAFNMRRVETLGVGKTLTWKELLINPQSLLKMSTEIIRNISFHQNSAKLQNLIASYRPAEQAADIIEGVKFQEDAGGLNV
ncbi:MAG: glycosyl transferase family [Geobacteraceae bacterium]|nr:MAG: glycosyl transferase family [Geobacteraceae bacterium]